MVVASLFIMFDSWCYLFKMMYRKLLMFICYYVDVTIL